MYKKVLLATIAAVVQALQIGSLSDQDCVNTNGDLRNKYGGGCDYYEGKDYMCGSAFLEKGLEFDSSKMCCACPGGGDRSGGQDGGD